MKRFRPARREFQLWIGPIGAWRPHHWSDLPPRFVALQPAEEACYSAEHALAFLEGFNCHMLATGGRHWAVALAAPLPTSGDLIRPRLFSGHYLRRHGPLRAIAVHQEGVCR
jgi:hypothetical protein